MSSLRMPVRLFASWLRPHLPSYLIYFVTARCNARCSMCFYWREMEKFSPEKEMSPDETTKIAKHLPPLLQLTLSGGEPFLREDLFELVKPLIEKGRPEFLSIPTNGILTDKIIRISEKICSAFPGLNINLELSIDGIGEIHDQIRGKKGAYENVLDTWRELKAVQKKFKHLRLATLTVLSAYNQDNILALLKFIKYELEPDRMEVMLARGETREKSAKEVNLEKFKQASQWLARESPEQNGFINKLREKLAEEKRNLIIETVEKNQMLIPCVAGKKLLVIEPDGTVLPCEMLSILYPNMPAEPGITDIALGSLREANYELRKILKSEKAQKILNLIQKNQCYCTYECAILANFIFQPGKIFRILS